MIAKQLIQANLDNCLTDTTFLKLPGYRRGKVRDAYTIGDTMILVTTDRQSAFDRILASVPFKGQVLNQISSFWFDKTSDIVSNHRISLPDPNVLVARKCTVIPIEFVVRGYLTGSTDTSAWTLYAQGQRTICGNRLPDGMVKNQQFAKPLLTPTTKSEHHDESISVAEIIERGIVSKQLWERCEAIVFALFQRGVEIARSNGVILVDTKYELGLDSQGNVVLIDEIHTPDSSRYWIAASYNDRFNQGMEPESIDKEFLRLWFKKNCDPYHDTQLPKAPDDLVVELSSRYIQLFEMITGTSFSVDTSLPINERITRNCAKLAATIYTSNG